MTSAPTTSHLLVVLTHHRGDDARALAADVRVRARAAGGPGVAVEVAHDVAAIDRALAEDLPAAVVVLAGPDPWNSAGGEIDVAVARCRRHLVPVLPVCSDLGRARAELPKVVAELNAVAWASGVDCAPVSAVLLRMLAISEEDRRVFLSHRRSDGSALAEQLRTELSDDRWDVFLDRFSIPPGADFQRRLDRELGDKSFILLLETPEANGSPWVQHEVTYALRNHLSLRSLALPTTKKSELFPVLQGDWRIELAAQDVTGPSGALRLRGTALARVRVELEQAHARAQHLRRAFVLQDVKGQLERTGRIVRAVSDWVLVGDRAGQREVVLVTPRAPSPVDLRTVDLLRLKYRAREGRTRGWLVHPLEEVDRERRTLLRWLTGRRLIGAAPVMLFERRLT